MHGRGRHYRVETAHRKVCVLECRHQHRRPGHVLHQESGQVRSRLNRHHRASRANKLLSRQSRAGADLKDPRVPTDDSFGRQRVVEAGWVRRSGRGVVGRHLLEVHARHRGKGTRPRRRFERGMALRPHRNAANECVSRARVGRLIGCQLLLLATGGRRSGDCRRLQDCGVTVTAALQTVGSQSGPLGWNFVGTTVVRVAATSALDPWRRTVTPTSMGAPEVTPGLLT